MTERIPKGRLQWRCRRGTKELDVVLNSYLDAQYDNLSNEDLLGFNKLLDAQDTDLWMWLTGKYEADNEENSYWVKKILAK